ncbi:MAG: hypothetical protein JXA20_08125 [Spirochaetes bacterium]|nr:hypothetical protein [Spirochaetota bacterium]
MNTIYRLKRRAAEFLIALGNRRHPFHLSEAENHRLPQGAPDHYNDSYYFTGHNERGNSIILRLGFRGDGESEAWCALHFEGKKYNLEGEGCRMPGDRSIGELAVKCREPGSRWSLSFEGGLRSDGSRVVVSLDAEFSSPFPVFHFNTDMPPSTMASAMAAERWTGRWFRQLSGWHQTHYEQCGEIRGRLLIGKKTHTLAMRAIRDHSYGPRRWSDMNRHVWLAITLDDGRFVNYSLVSYPILRHIRAGFLQDGNRFVPVTGGSSLDDLNRGGEPPAEFGFQIQLADGSFAEATCRNRAAFSWLMGGSYRVTEAIAHFSLAGVPGCGICEFGYRIGEGI